MGMPALIHAALFSVATGSVAVRTALCPLQHGQWGRWRGAPAGDRVLSSNVQAAQSLSPSSWLWGVMLGELYLEQQDLTLGCPAGSCIVGGFVWEGEEGDQSSCGLNVGAPPPVICSIPDP